MNPLICTTPTTPQGQPKVNDLVTWVDYKGREYAGRLTRIAYGSYFVKAIGFNTAPYEVGQIIPRERQHIIDWE